MSVRIKDIPHESGVMQEWQMPKDYFFAISKLFHMLDNEADYVMVGITKEVYIEKLTTSTGWSKEKATRIVEGLCELCIELGLEPCLTD